MQIIIDESEITQAIENFVRKQINIAEGQEVVTSLKAGRGDNGFSAQIEIRDVPQASAKKAAASKRTTAAPAQPTVASHIAARVAEDQAQADSLADITAPMQEADAIINDEPAPEPKPVPVKASGIFAPKAAVQTEPATEDAPVAEEQPAAEPAPRPAAKPMFSFGAKPAQPFAAE